MAKVHAPFPMTRTMGGLTFYMMDGVNYVRTKSSLTRKTVLKSAAFRKTRQYAGMMSQASRIGSVIYQALPGNWRQGWMYRAFTGEAMQFLKEGRSVQESTRLLWTRYVEAINHHGADLGEKLEAAVDSPAATHRGTRKKKDPRVKRLKPYSDMLTEASKMASALYQSLPVEERKFSLYRVCVSEAMRLLQSEQSKSEQVLRCPAPAAVGQSPSTPVEPMAQDSTGMTQKLAAHARSFTNTKKPNRSTGKVPLFHIPLFDATLSKAGTRRRRHRRSIARSP